MMELLNFEFYVETFWKNVIRLKHSRPNMADVINVTVWRIRVVMQHFQKSNPIRMDRPLMRLDRYLIEFWPELRSQFLMKWQSYLAGQNRRAHFMLLRLIGKLLFHKVVELVSFFNIGWIQIFFKTQESVIVWH